MWRLLMKTFWNVIKADPLNKGERDQPPANGTFAKDHPGEIPVLGPNGTMWIKPIPKDDKRGK